MAVCKQHVCDKCGGRIESYRIGAYGEPWTGEEEGYQKYLIVKTPGVRSICLSVKENVHNVGTRIELCDVCTYRILKELVETWYVSTKEARHKEPVLTSW